MLLNRRAASLPFVAKGFTLEWYWEEQSSKESWGADNLLASITLLAYSHVIYQLNVSSSQNYSNLIASVVCKEFAVR